MDCKHCAGPLLVFEFQRKAAMQAPQMVRCQKCGSSHSLLRTEIEVINPRPLPLGMGAKQMPWRGAPTRPIDAGVYECRFRDIEPRILSLEWNGAAFFYQGQRVRMSTFMAWRGEWEA